MAPVLLLSRQGVTELGFYLDTSKDMEGFHVYSDMTVVIKGG
jgi:hypothetical protein